MLLTEPYINPAVFQKFRRDLVKSLGIDDPDVDVVIPIESRPVQATPQPKASPTAFANSSNLPKSEQVRRMIKAAYERGDRNREAAIQAVIDITQFPKARALGYFRGACEQQGIPVEAFQ